MDLWTNFKLFWPKLSLNRTKNGSNKSGIGERERERERGKSVWCVCERERERKRSEMSAGLIVNRKVPYSLQVKILTTGNLAKENSAHSIILIQMDHNLGRSAPSTVIFHLNSEDFVLVNLLCEISLQKFPLGVRKSTYFLWHWVNLFEFQSSASGQHVHDNNSNSVVGF